MPALVLVPERGLFNRYGLFTVALIPLRLAAGLAVMHLTPVLAASLVAARAPVCTRAALA